MYVSASLLIAVSLTVGIYVNVMELPRWSPARGRSSARLWRSCRCL
jgi:hypothetical protein